MAEKNETHERPSSLFQARPKIKNSVSFSGWSGLHSPTNKGLYAATSQGTYSRYGVGVMSPTGPTTRPLRISLQHTEPSSKFHQQYTQNYQNFRTRRHTMGTIYATTPLRSPPVPPITPVHRSSIDRTSQWPGSPTYENTTMTLTPALCASISECAQALQDPQTGVHMQERLVVNQTKRVFTGADAIQWLVHNVEGIASVEAAQLAGNHLLDSGLIVGVSQPGQMKFIGSPNALYQFALPKEEQETIPNETENNTPKENTMSSAGNDDPKSKCLIQ